MRRYAIQHQHLKFEEPDVGKAPDDSRQHIKNYHPTLQTPQNVLQLQRLVGNQAVMRMLGVQSSASNKVPDIQRISVADLHKLGKFWNALVWMQMGKDADARQQIIEQSNKLLGDLGFSLGRGFQAYDPVIRPARRYTAIATELDKDAVNYANQFVKFYTGKSKLEDLPKSLQEWCIIVFLAETGRGYDSAIVDMLRFVVDIADGKAKWGDVKDRYAPSLTYGEDNSKSGEFVPSGDEMEISGGD